MAVPMVPLLELPSTRSVLFLQHAEGAPSVTQPGRNAEDVRTQMDALFPSVAWDRAGLVSEHDYANRYSRQHRYVEGSEHTLCGARIRWLYYAPGDSTRCERCDRIAWERVLSQ